MKSARRCRSSPADAGPWVSACSCWRSPSTPAQQMGHRDPRPEADAGRRFREALRGMDGRSRSTAVRSSTTCRSSRASRRRRTSSATTSARRSKLTYYADMLKYYRALAAATPRVKVETIGKSDEGRELVVVWVSSEENIKNLAAEPRQPRQARRSARPHADAQIQQLIATTKPHYHLMGGLHSSETGPVGDADGAGLPARDRDVADHHADSQQRVRVDHAGGRCGRARSQRRLVLPRLETAALAARRCGRRRPVQAGCEPAAGDRGPPTRAASRRERRRRRRRPWRRGGAARAAVGLRRRRVRAAVLGQVRLPRQQPRHQPLADADARAHRLVLHRASADHARPARSAGADVHYSGGPPQNPNLDPLLFAELPWFSNWELAQMTKWGMPGVYTHAFMDGWSPGYLGSVAYNHNGMMRMYETQSGRDTAARCGRGGGGRRRGGRGGRGGGAPPERRRGCRRGAAGALAAQRAGAAGGAGAGAADVAGAAAGGAGGQRGGGDAGGRAGSSAAAARRQRAPAARAAAAGAAAAVARRGARCRRDAAARRIASGIAASRFRRTPRRTSRGATTRTTCRPACSRRCSSTAMFPNVVARELLHEDEELDRGGQDQGAVRLRDSGAARHDEAGRCSSAFCARRASKSAVATAEFKIGETTYPRRLVRHQARPAVRPAREEPAREAGLSRFAPHHLRRQRLDDGLAFNVEVKEIARRVDPQGRRDAGHEGRRSRARSRARGTAGLAVAHFGSNNMIAFRYKLKNVPMKIAEKSFTVGRHGVPGGVVRHRRRRQRRGGSRGGGRVRPHGGRAVERCRRWHRTTRTCRASRSTRSGRGTQDLGWYRLDVRQVRHSLRPDLQGARRRRAISRRTTTSSSWRRRTSNRADVAGRRRRRAPSPYLKSDKYKFLGMYGETPDMTGGFGQEGVDAFAKFLEGGGTLIAAGNAVRFPIEFGCARTCRHRDAVPGVTAQRPLVQAEIVEHRSSGVLRLSRQARCRSSTCGGQPSPRRASPTRTTCWRAIVGGDAAVLSAADGRRRRACASAPFAVDVPGAYNGKGRVILFTNNPVYRWQNHGEFNMMFNSILNWNDVGK